MSKLFGCLPPALIRILGCKRACNGSRFSRSRGIKQKRRRQAVAASILPGSELASCRFRTRTLLGIDAVGGDLLV
jgi:hypothetical protein